MRATGFAILTAAFVLSCAGSAPSVASAQLTPSHMRKDAEIKNPAAANAAVVKDEAKYARKEDRRARRHAKVAAHKAHLARRKAEEAARRAH